MDTEEPEDYPGQNIVRAFERAADPTGKPYAIGKWTRAYSFGDDLPVWMEGHATPDDVRKEYIKLFGDHGSLAIAHLLYGEEVGEAIRVD